jgi:hypothetical protein
MFVFFPISIVRVFLNHKISATVGELRCQRFSDSVVQVRKTIFLTIDA